MKNEKKEHVVPIRLTENEYQEVKKRATEKNQSISRCVVESVVGNTSGLTLSQRQNIYSSLLLIRDATRQFETANSKKIIIEECNKIWKSLSN